MMSQFLDKIVQNNQHLSWIKDRIILAVRHGSWAYGTNIPESDEDFKSVCIPPSQYYLSIFQRFEQVELKDPDAVVYELQKFMRLASACNPSIIETLYVDAADIIYVSDVGRILFDNRDKFLSQLSKNSFLGYARAQAKRIKVHRGFLLSPPKQPITRKEFGLPEKSLLPQNQIDAANAIIHKEMDTSPAASWLESAQKVGLDDNLILLLQKEKEYSGKSREWDQYQEWKKHRNPKRAEMEAKFGFDGKHALHLVRLTRMGKELLTTGKVIVKRPDREELLSIRAGKWTYDQLMEYIDKEHQSLIEYQCTILPKTPDFNYLDKLCIELIERMR